MPQEAKTQKKFNPSLGGAFSNDAFGEGSVLLNITPENFDTLMKSVQVGSAILLKYNKVTTKGNKHYFAEVLPPMDRKPTVVRKATTTSDLG
jgi:hypothetical protein